MAASKPKPRARKAAPKRAAAARRETKPTSRTVEYRGLKLEVPAASEWSSEIYFLLGDLNEADEQGGGFSSLSIANKIVVELIGAEQFAMVRVKLREDKVKLADTEKELVSLFNAVFSEYGTSVGESNASPDS